MKKCLMRVQREFCGECSLAIMHFMRNIEGVESVETGEGMVAITFDETKIDESSVKRITQENIEKLGYKIEG